MFCRLCVFECDEKEGNIKIFDNSEESSLTKLIVKYLLLEISENDEFSTIVCADCCQHLKDFERFAQKIEHRQVVLKAVFLSGNPLENIKDEITENKQIVPLEWPKNQNVYKNLQSKTSYNKITQIAKNCSDLETSMHAEENLNDIFVEDNLELDDTKNLVHKLNAGHSNDKVNNLQIGFSEKKIEVAKSNDFISDESNDVKYFEQQPKEEKKSRIYKTSKEERNIRLKKIKENDELIEKFANLKCDKCGILSKNFLDFQDHFRVEHNEQAYLRCCGLLLRKKWAITTHIRIHLNPDSTKCSFCGKTLSNKFTLRAHVKRYHTDKKNLTKICTICDKRFFGNGELKAHMMVHDDGKIYKCESCDKSFKYESTLKAHQKRDHEHIGRSVCYLCGTEYKYKQQFEQHMAKKHNICSKKTLKQCDDCHKWFSLNNIKKHEERHKLQDVECDKCGKILPSRIALYKHKNRHPKIKTGI